MHGSRFRQQDGFVRESVTLLLIVVVIAVVVLDAVTLIQTNQTVKGNANDAALAAAETYVQTNDNDSALAAAKSFLADHNDTMLGFSWSNATGTMVYTVTAQRHAQTYAFHYLAKLPHMKDWVERLLNPKATRSSNSND